MLFESASVYAPGEPGTQDLPRAQGQNVSWLGKYHLDQLRPPNILIGLIGLIVLAYLVHKHGGHGGRRKR